MNIFNKNRIFLKDANCSTLCHYTVISVGVNLMSTKTYAVLRYANGMKLHDFSTKNKANTCFKHLNVKFIM